MNATDLEIAEKNLRNPLWRINNLYQIIDKEGKKCTFRLNWAQEELYKNLWYCNIILKARQLGISTFVGILFLDRCLFNSNVAAGIIAHTREDAEVFFKRIKFACALGTFIGENHMCPAPLGHPNYASPDNPGGRPRRYSLEDIERFADELLIWIKNESNFWMKDFCLEKGIDPRLMQDWCKESERFSECYSLAKSQQESRIFKGSMMEMFNAGMSKFALINHHGWAEKSESKISGDAANPLTFLLTKVDGSSKDLVSDECD